MIDHHKEALEKITRILSTWVDANDAINRTDDGDDLEQLYKERNDLADTAMDEIATVLDSLKTNDDSFWRHFLHLRSIAAVDR